MKEINKQEDESRDADSLNEEDNAKKHATNDYKDSYEMSKKALLQCNQIPKNSGNFLKVGDGHFVSNPFRPIRNTYKAVFDTPDANIGVESKIYDWRSKYN